MELYVKRTYVENPSRYLRYRKRAASLEGEDRAYALLRRALTRLAGEGVSTTPTILDLGCGADGYLTREDFSTYFGIDISLGLLRKHVLRRETGAFLICGDVDRLPMLLSGIDIAIGHLVLHYLLDPARLFRTLAAPGRAFLWIIPNPAYDRLHGEVGDIRTTLEIGDWSFTYRTLDTDHLPKELGSTRALNVEESVSLRPSEPGMYLSISGIWT